MSKIGSISKFSNTCRRTLSAPPSSFVGLEFLSIEFKDTIKNIKAVIKGRIRMNVFLANLY